MTNVVEVTFSVTTAVDSEFPPDKYADDIISTARLLLSPAEVTVVDVRISDSRRAASAKRLSASR